MKNLAMVVAVAALLAGCATTTEQGAWKDWGVCLEHGIIDAQACDAAYDSGTFPPKGSPTSLAPDPVMDARHSDCPTGNITRCRRAPEPVVVAQLFGREHHREQPLDQPGYETLRRSQQIMRDHEALRRLSEHTDSGRRLRDLERQIQRDNPFLNGQYQREQQIQDQERRLGDLERQRQIERSNDFYRQRTR